MMPEFILNSAGTVRDVRAPSIEAIKRVDLDFCDLDAFTQGYIEALFFTEEENLDSDLTEFQGAVGRADRVGFSNLAPKALARIIADCERFQREHAEDLADACDTGRIVGYGETEAGRDFWYTRNGHGVGYWDRGLGDIGETLAEHARKAGSADAYLGDDGHVHLDGGRA